MLLIKSFGPSLQPNVQEQRLGLSLSCDIIKAHGGEIKVESKEGKGAVFIIQYCEW
jgi:signal transduction histidine kinase